MNPNFPVIPNKAAIDARIRSRFNVMSTLVQSTIEGESRSLIVSSPSGLGKSFSVEKALSKWDESGKNYCISRGYVLTTGLIRLIFAYRNAGQVLVFDDADTVFKDLDSINLLKAICDTTERRYITYRTDKPMFCEITGQKIDKTFEFRGSVIFLTNMNFDTEINKKGPNTLGPHFAALISRSHYIDLAMNSAADYIVRIEQVCQEGLLDFLPKGQDLEVLDFIYSHQSTLRELSLRMAIKLGKLRKLGDKWKDFAEVTCCRNK